MNSSPYRIKTELNESSSIEGEIEFDKLIHAIFKLYTTRIEQIVVEVKQSKSPRSDMESIITHTLSDFKQ